MSGKVSGQVWELDLPHHHLLVLLALADHADHEGENAFPSVGLIAWKTGYSERQVQRIMKALVAAGLLVPVGVSQRQTVCYRIDVSAGRQKPPRAATGGDILSPRQNVTGDKMSPGGVTKCHRQNVTGDIAMSPGGVTQLCHRGGDIAMSPEPSIEPSIEPSVNNTTSYADVPAELLSFHLELEGQPGYKPNRRFFRKLLDKYSSLDLAEEAMAMVAWLDTPNTKLRGRTPRQCGKECNILFILNWLKRASEDQHQREQADWVARGRPPPREQLQDRSHRRQGDDAATRANRLGADQGQPRGEDPDPGVHGLEQRDTIR